MSHNHALESLGDILTGLRERALFRRSTLEESIHYLATVEDPRLRDPSPVADFIPAYAKSLSREAKLSPLHERIFLLRCMGFALPEIAEALNLPRSRVRSIQLSNSLRLRRIYLTRANAWLTIYSQEARRP